MKGARRTAYAVEPFGGVRFGMRREEAVALLRAWARREDGFGGESVYLEGASASFVTVDGAVEK